MRRIGLLRRPHERQPRLRSLVDATWIISENWLNYMDYHDRAVTGQIDLAGFSSLAAKAIAWTRERLSPAEIGLLAALPLRAEIDGVMLAVHGAWHVDQGCEWARLSTDEERRKTLQAVVAHPSGARICAVGHSHFLRIHRLDGTEVHRLTGDELELVGGGCYLINPGTIGDPRSSEHRATYLIYDSAAARLEVRRITYDFLTTLRKTAAAGLRPLSPVNRLPRPIRSAIKRFTRRPEE